MMYRVASDFRPSRRAFLAGSAALLATSAITPALAASVSSFVDGVWQEAKGRGVSRSTFDAAMDDFRPMPKVMELSRVQPEFTITPSEYVTKRVTSARIDKGKAEAGEWAETLAGVESRWGVQGEAVLAIWGMETNFGGYMGDMNTVHALATLVHGGYRSSYFRGELLTSLQILEAGLVSAPNMIGSWAGAMGHTQFMPTSFMKYAVDYRGDGKKDIWNSVPDALASAANYLKEFGWDSGKTWGYEVKIPQGFDYMHAWSDNGASVGWWSDQGITRTSGRPFPRASDQARLFTPMGGNGPTFLTLTNFGVIKRYNNSDSYALSVGHLADRILGGGGFAVAWPDDSKLDEDGRRDVQTALLGKGYSIGSDDGVIG
jgi:membrane-bound lytic murein transglycosylase B